MILFHLSGQGRELRVYIGNRHARLQAARSERPARLPLRRRLWRHGHRHDHLGARLRRKPQPGRRDADDLTELLSQPHATADDLGIRAELRLPELVTEHHHRRRPGPRVTFLEHAAMNGLGAKHFEQPRRRDERRDSKWIPEVEDRAVEAAEPVQTLEHVLARGEIDEITERDELLRHARSLIAMIQNHDVVSVRIRQRAQHHRLEHREDGHVGADRRAPASARRPT